MSEGETRPASGDDPTVDDGPVDPDNLMGRGMRILLGAYLAAVCALLLYLFGKFWPAELKGAAWGGEPSELLFWWGQEIKTSAELRILVLVLCAGALGSMLHAVQSFLDFHGNQRLAKSWLPWYLMRPFVGALLALVFYLLIRGGLIAGASPAGDVPVPVNLIGLVGAAALVGMFSDLASLKLKEVFTTMFASTTKRADPLVDGTATAKPSTTDADPQTSAKGQPTSLTVRASGAAGSWKGTAT
jgi:hypothetical protein